MKRLVVEKDAKTISSLRPGDPDTTQIRKIRVAGGGISLGFSSSERGSEGVGANHGVFNSSCGGVGVRRVEFLRLKNGVGADAATTAGNLKQSGSGKPGKEKDVRRTQP